MKRKLPPIPPNLGLENYDWFTPIEDISDAIKRWQKGERPEDLDERHKWILINQGRGAEITPA
jgi:hypothetical protein